MHRPCGSARRGHLSRWPVALGLAVLACYAATGRAAAGTPPDLDTRAGLTNVALAAPAPPAPGNGRASWGQRLDNGVDLLVSVSGLKAAGPDLQRDRELVARVSRGAWSFSVLRGDRRSDHALDTDPIDALLTRPDPAERFALAQLQFQDGDAHDTLQLRGRLYTARAQWLGTDHAWQGGEWRLRSTAWAGHTLTAGLQVQGPGQDRDPGDLADTARGPGLGLDAQDEWRVSPTLLATSGLRLDRQGRTGTTTRPRAALAWQVTPLTVLKALIGTLRAARGVCAGACGDAGGPGDGGDLLGPTALAGARTASHELTAEHRVGPGLALHGTAFRRSVRDAGTAGPGDRVQARGLRLRADQTWERGGRLSGSLALQRVDDARGAASDDVPRLLGRLDLSLPLPGVLLACELSGGRVGGGGVASLNLSLALRPVGLGLTLGLQHLPDRRSVRVELAGRF